MLANILIVLIIILIIGVTCQGNSSPKQKKEKKLAGQTNKNQDNASESNDAQNELGKNPDSEQTTKLTEAEKQQKMKILGGEAYDKGLQSTFSTLHILDFGTSFDQFLFSDDKNSNATYQDLSQENKQILDITIADMVSGLNSKDILCFKSGPQKMLKSLVNHYRRKHKNILALEKDDSIRALLLNFGIKNVERKDFNSFIF